MAGENAFNKKLGAETHMDKVEGLLEHLNLPPKAIDFIRKNQRVIQVAIAVIVIVVVFWSLYGSYREKIREEAGTALSLALRSDQQAKTEGLRAVASEYAGTSSAIWARVELAHIDMKNGLFDEASKKYQEVLSDTSAGNPIYPLVVFSLAQAFEKEQRYQDAISQYELLKNLKGFELIAYTSMAGIKEAQGDIEQAIAIYNNFLLQMGDDPTFSQAKEEINAKISRLKTQK